MNRGLAAKGARCILRFPNHKGSRGIIKVSGKLDAQGLRITDKEDHRGEVMRGTALQGVDHITVVGTTGVTAREEMGEITETGTEIEIGTTLKVGVARLGGTPGEEMTTDHLVIVHERHLRGTVAGRLKTYLYLEEHLGKYRKSK